MIKTLNRSTLLTLICLAGICFALVMSTFESRAMQSADLYAMWLAGDFLSMGQPDQVYPANIDRFDMTPPVAWWPYVVQIDPEARIFPYIYPPIWAKLVSFMIGHVPFSVFDVTMLALHQALLLGSAFLALRLCGMRSVTLLVAATATYAALVMTMPIGIALGENQPQILVSFLIVAAFERAYSRHPKLAGGLLALAASMKVYPLLFIVIFAARRQWQTVAWFVIVGAGLALVSIALSGWALHAEYLRLLSVVSKSVIVTKFSFSIDALLATSFFQDQLVSIQYPRQVAQVLDWSAIAKGPIWVALSGVAQIAAIAGIAALAARHPDDALVMPLAATVFALLSPLSWAYTYLTAFVFLAGLVTRLGQKGILLCVVMAVAFHPTLAQHTLDITLFGVSSFWVIGLGLMGVMAGAFLTAVLGRR
ncbi:MAG: glycosyltransferase family 87 protein [Yoonia sp.]|uniref:glycosyltransferase family 87 protein n=1 Tax=Yoonia sp. TaxID=2212373 RepID=UPI003EF407C6